MTNNNAKNNLTAAQKLQNLENAASMLDETMGKIEDTLRKTVNGMRLLSNKVEAMKRASGLTDEQVSGMLVKLHIEDLEERVQNMKEIGIIESAEEIDVKDGYVVARELNRDTKEIATQRVQFSVGSQPEKLRNILAGKKAGDLIDSDPKKNLLEILEVYKLVTSTPKQPDPAKEEPPQENAAEAAPEAGPQQSQTNS